MIYITGDTHGLINVDKVSQARFPDGQNLTMNDYLIIVGDFGGLFYGGERDEKALNFWRSKPYMVLWLDGNHENFDILSTYPVEEWNGGKVQKIAPNIIHLMRGEIYTIEDKTFFVFGGAKSVDRGEEVEHRGWWREEQGSMAEMYYAMDNLQKHENKVDYVLTHAAPRAALEELANNRLFYLYETTSVTEEFLNEVLNTVEYKTWFCGHYHKDIRLRSFKLEFLFDNILKLSPGLPLASRKIMH